jgi:hypothetical protein
VVARVISAAYAARSITELVKKLNAAGIPPPTPKSPWTARTTRHFLAIEAPDLLANLPDRPPRDCARCGRRLHGFHPRTDRLCGPCDYAEVEAERASLISTRPKVFVRDVRVS